MSFKLLSVSNSKTRKGEAMGYATYILHLAPADLSGVGNVCPKASAGCKAACLNTAGHGGMFKKGTTTNVVQEARIRRTKWFFADTVSFMEALVADIVLAQKQAARQGLIPVFRLNGTSDIVWEKIQVGTFRNIMERFPALQFYDYTKIPKRKPPYNYHLTFSRSECNDDDCETAVQQGMKISVVFNKVPEYWYGRKIINGDAHDLRFLDDSKGPIVVGLKAKGRAKKDITGFVM